MTAFIVIGGGGGCTARDYFTSGKLAEHLIHAAVIPIVILEPFIRLANNR
jgi:hypothetical protein